MKRNANFTNDKRGCTKLLGHVGALLEKGSLDRDLLTLDLSGTRAASCEDRRCLQKVIGSFDHIRAILLNGCRLQEVGFLSQLLCSKYIGCQRVDLAGNLLSRQHLENFIAVLEGRSYKDGALPFYLAVGEGMDELLTPTTACNPFSATGCRCKSRRVVHVLAQFAPKPALVTKVPSPTLPPPPAEDPPPAPPDLIVFAQSLAAVRKQLHTAAALESEKGRCATVDGKAYVLVVCRARYYLVDFCSAENGFVHALDGECLPIHLIDMVQAEACFSGRAEPFSASLCATPDSYLETAGGEAIQFFLHSSGWAAATLEGHSEHRWFPVSRCLC